MLKIYLTLCSLIVLNISVYTQETTYFNNVYNPESTYGSGRGILQVDNNYYGIFGTYENSSYWYKLAVFKMDMLGNLIDYNLIGEENHDYFVGTVGGTLINTLDGNLAFSCQIQNPDSVYGTLIKTNLDLDTIWKKNYSTDNIWTMTIKAKQTTDGGYMIVGNVKPEQGEYYNILLLCTDNNGNKLWHQTYGGNWSEHGTDMIQTPDGGYLIGGYFWKPGQDHSLDAMVIKTDSLGNEEWTKYYGNPYVDDDMALVAMADDGNYLVATVYGDEIFSNEVHTGRLNILKIDLNGNIISDNKYGQHRINFQIKNFRKVNNGFIASGFSKETDSVTFQYMSGWMMKLDNNLDSVWYRDYIHGDENWESYFYDASPTSDNGYIAIGKARPDMGGTNNMWIVKVDSMGCDTAGCATGVFIEELSPSGGGRGEIVQVWPNPVNNALKVKSCAFKETGDKTITIYNPQGIKTEEIKIPINAEIIEVDVSKYHKGIYYIQYIQSGRIKGTTKFIKQ